ncbi:MAG: Rieske 2Fe-2S domain-containing protein [Burkholderiales bacterium]
MQLTEDLPFQALRRTWQPVTNAANLARDAVTGCILLDTELVLARFADGRLLAADVACPHKGTRLSAGRIRAGELMCAYHGWRFDAPALPRKKFIMTGWDQPDTAQFRVAGQFAEGDQAWFDDVRLVRDKQ